ncbi:hypothetical protein AYI69_g10570 [Smittium culicis]|uniref:Uncharacterized protein n=1 Tax=Smittium culicis TaxID=133412 RepID=A0A1R1X4T0_9FUNG|nr:hypothetical protein AYI69_g10570 [Smittium culicis]
MQKNSAKKIAAGKKEMLMNMSRYKEVSIKNILFGGEKNCLKKFCTDGSDMKVICVLLQAELPTVSANPQPDDSKSEATEAQTSIQVVEESKNINDTEVSTNGEAIKAKTGTINHLRGIVGLKKSPASFIAAAEIKSSPIEKVSSGDDTESDGSIGDNSQPKFKKLAYGDRKKLHTLKFQPYEKF